MLILIENENQEYYNSLEDLFFNKLKNKDIDFTKLSETYIRYLEYEKDLMNQQINEADIPLINAYKKHKGITKNDAKNLIIRYLIKYKRFKGAPIFTQLEQIAREENLDLEGGYICNLYKEGDK